MAAALLTPSVDPVGTLIRGPSLNLEIRRPVFSALCFFQCLHPVDAFEDVSVWFVF